MRERPDRRLRSACPALVFAAWLCVAPALSADEAPPLREYEIQEAIERLRADPAFASERSVRRLEWIEDEAEERSTPGWFAWIRELFGWLAATSRLLVWLLIGTLVGLLVVLALRLVRAAGGRAHAKAAAPPTHVHDLDIRPESLPDDIGAAAWALWDGGRQREALALLYRGLLSRLVHVHAVPIRDSSTEGDSLELATRHLPAVRHGYVRALVRTWQRAVYGGRLPAGADVQALCGHFEGALMPVEAASGAAP